MKQHVLRITIVFLLATTVYATSPAEAPLFLAPAPASALAKTAVPRFVTRRAPVACKADLRSLSAITLDLFGETVQVERTRFVPHTATHYEWFGHLAGDVNSSVLFVAFGGTWVGKIESRGRFFEVRSLGGDRYALDETDMAALRASVSHDGHDFLVNPARPAGSPTPPALPTPKGAPAARKTALAAVAAPTQIDVMVLYDQDALNRRADMVPFINTLIAEANDAYVRSNVNQVLRLVHVEKIEKGYDSATQVNLDAARKDPDIERLRKQYGADLVPIMTAETNATRNTGLAYTEDPISLVTVCCAQSLRTFTHEMGHNMGALHSREQYPNPSGYNYGYRDAAHGFITIMSYLLECDNCAIINSFSSPDIWYNGVPTGVVNMSDNARALREHVAMMANFMSDAYALKVEKTGQGRIKSDIAGIDCGVDCEEAYAKPQIRTVTLSAVPDAGFVFKGWSGACQGTGTCTVAMGEDRKVSALFEADAGNLTVSLYDLKGKKSIANLEGTASFRVDTLSPQLTVQANLKSAAGSVKFEVTGPLFRTFTVSTPPFTLFGSQSGQPLPWTPVPTGRFNLGVTAYSGPDGSGTVISSKRLVLDLKAPNVGNLDVTAAPLSGLLATERGLELRLDHPAALEVTLRGLSGRETVLLRGSLPAGSRSLAWSEHPGLSEGIYLLRVTHAGRSLLRRMIRIPRTR